MVSQPMNVTQNSILVVLMKWWLLNTWVILGISLASFGFLSTFIVDFMVIFALVKQISYKMVVTQQK